ncbi:MAG: response regulator transcription factor, partial [Pyrinomonadaceae bacterium]|nr:response regulator transcription factor [Sphingobacteriaceae bacterium]
MDIAPKIRVFIIDDHQLIIDGVQSLIKGDDEIIVSGYTHQADQVLKLLSQHPSDIVICDVNLPGMSGVELSRKIKQQYPDIKIIALSMFGDKGAIAEMLQAGVSG